MAGLGIYAVGNIYVDGGLLAQETEMSIHRMTNSNPVSTVALGYAGESPGAAMVEIDVDNAVPSEDFELDPAKYMLNLGVAEITAFIGEKKVTYKGFIIEDTFKHGVNSAAGLSFKFRGRFDGTYN